MPPAIQIPGAAGWWPMVAYCCRSLSGSAFTVPGTRQHFTRKDHGMTHPTHALNTLRSLLCDAAIRFDETEVAGGWRTLAVHTHDGARVACMFTPAGALERLTLHGAAGHHTPAGSPAYTEETLTRLPGVDGWWHATTAHYDATHDAQHCPLCGGRGWVGQGLFHCTGGCHALAVVADGRTFQPATRPTGAC